MRVVVEGVGDSPCGLQFQLQFTVTGTYQKALFALPFALIIYSTRGFASVGYHALYGNVIKNI